MLLPDLYGTLYPDISRQYMSDWFEKHSFPLYKGDTFNSDLVVSNDGTEKAETFNIDLYISTDKIVNASDRYLGTYTFADGIDGESSFSTYYNFPKSPATITLPNADDAFWQEDLERYYLGAVIDPENAIAESNEDNNSPNSSFDYSNDSVSTSTPITIKQADLPVASFTQNDNTLNINLSEPASASGFTVNYQNITKQNYLNGINIPNRDNYQYWHRYIRSSFFDLESNRFYIQRENYYDLKDYKYYDADGGHYDPTENKYFNADGSYYDVSEKLFYDADGNATELIDNSAEYTSLSSSPRHYLPTGGYISLISGIYYDARGGYIDEADRAYFLSEGEDGLGSRPQKLGLLKTEVGSLEFGIGGRIPNIAKPGLDYEIVPGSNITDITNSIITVAPGETNATIDFNFLSDTVFDPNETIEIELLDNEEYVVGRSSLYRYFAPLLDLKDLQNPRLGEYNFSVDKNAKPNTKIGHINFSDPQGDKLFYSLVNGQSELKFDRYTDIDLPPDLIQTSNQDLDGDGIHPFSIDATGTISLTDFDDLDREAVNNVALGDRSQLYNSGYYQLFVRVTDTVPTEEDRRYSTRALYETNIVNVRVADIATTSKSDRVLGLPDRDSINGLAGDDTIDGLAGDDSLYGGKNSDYLLGSNGNDVLRGNTGDDVLNGGNDNDLLSGGIGDDFLIGREGDDSLNGGTENDRLLGGSGNDLLVGQYGEDTLNGGEDDDVLKGKEDNDLLVGGTGDDILYGGMGLDRLIGNAGKDTFVLETNSGQDFIADFEDEADVIKLPDDTSFEQINIIDLPLYSATAIYDKTNNEIIAVLKEVEVASITEADFI